jgi:hypothetical protein
VYLVIARIPARMGVTCRGHEHLAFAKHTLDALHPQAQLAGEDLETIVLASMYVVRTRSPAGRADPIHLEQLTPRVPGSLTEHGPEPGDRVYQVRRRPLPCLVLLCCSPFFFGLPATGQGAA